MSYSEDVLAGMRAVTEATTGLKDDSVDNLVSTMVLNLQSAKLQQDTALFNIKAGMAGEMINQGFTAYEAAVSNIEGSKLKSPQLEKYMETQPGIGYNIGKRRILSNAENYLDAFEESFVQNQVYYRGLITKSALVGGTSNPIIGGALDALVQQRDNLLEAKENYTDVVFEARGEGFLKSKKRPMNITARMDAAIGALDTIIEGIEG